MVTFHVANTRVSFLFILPLGFATGVLASTIAVGGFVGVPGMMYLLGASSLVASATEEEGIGCSGAAAAAAHLISKGAAAAGRRV